MESKSRTGAREAVAGSSRNPALLPERSSGRTEPPLDEIALADAEQELGVDFPPEYRAFLREVSAGGVGLYPLVRDDQGWHWRDSFDRRVRPARLGQPFQDAAERERLEAEYEALQPLHESFPDEESFTAAWRRWNQGWDELSERLESGTVQISDQGCGNYIYLVVTGPERGTVWWGSGPYLDPVKPSPQSSPADRVTFRQWYPFR